MQFHPSSLFSAVPSSPTLFWASCVGSALWLGPLCVQSAAIERQFPNDHTGHPRGDLTTNQSIEVDRGDLSPLQAMLQDCHAPLSRCPIASADSFSANENRTHIPSIETGFSWNRLALSSPATDLALTPYQPLPPTIAPPDVQPQPPRFSVSLLALPQGASSQLASLPLASPHTSSRHESSPHESSPHFSPTTLPLLSQGESEDDRSGDLGDRGEAIEAHTRSQGLPETEPLDTIETQALPTTGDLPAPALAPADPADPAANPADPSPELSSPNPFPNAAPPETAFLDPELGILRLQEQEPNLQPARPTAAPDSYPRFSYFLQGRLGYLYSSNVLGSQSSVDDYLTQEGISFSVVPQLSPRTAVIAKLGGSWSQYGEFYNLDYHQFSSQIRVRHSLTDRAYGELGWQHQQYFEADGGNQFLKTNTLQASLIHQTQLAPRLDLSNFYQSQLSLSDPSSRNQVVQRLGSGVTYALRPDLAVGASYNLEISTFTTRDRLDFYNQIIAHTAWEFAPRQRLRMFAGYSFGESSVETLKFDGFLFGLSLETGLRF